MSSGLPPRIMRAVVRVHHITVLKGCMKKLLQRGIGYLSPRQGSRFIASTGRGKATRSVDRLQLVHTPVLKIVCINTMITLAESEKGETLMRLSVGMKVGLVSLFSCLALWLGLLSPTGMVSAQTANTLQSAHISSIADTNPCSANTITFVNGEGPRYGCDNNQQLRQH